MKINKSILSACALAVLAGCGAATGSNTPSPNTVVNLQANSLQLAVGTANVYGTAGINVVATYRQPAGSQNPGASGALVSSPELVLPGLLPALAGSPGADATSTIVTGPGPAEIRSHAMKSTSQAAGTATITTFGQSGGVFGLGIEPFNYTTNGVPFAVAPYPVPLYDALSGTTAGDPNQLPAAWGGVPAFDLLGTGQAPNGSPIVPAGTLGVSEGLDVFEGVAPVVGTYTLNVSIPANTGTVTQSAAATLKTAALLPAFATPTFVPNGAGGGTFGVTLPAGVSEAYIEIVDLGTATTGAASCNGAPSVYYTIVAHASGTYTLGNTAGPGGAPSLCTAAQNTAANKATTAADSVYVQGIGFDYPLYEASYPQSKGNPTPAIVGANGQADVTISPAVVH